MFLWYVWKNQETKQDIYIGFDTNFEIIREE